MPAALENNALRKPLVFIGSEYSVEYLKDRICDLDAMEQRQLSWDTMAVSNKFVVRMSCPSQVTMLIRKTTLLQVRVKRVTDAEAIVYRQNFARETSKKRNKLLRCRKKIPHMSVRLSQIRSLFVLGAASHSVSLGLLCLESFCSLLKAAR